jgi:hypothetical protein
VDIKGNATTIAVAGVVAIAIGVVAVGFKTGNLDVETLKMITSNLMSFASGGAVVAGVAASSKSSKE